MWYVCELVRNRPVDDALKQLQFTFRKGAEIMIEMLNEAKERAKKEFNIEYPSNTFIAEAFPIQSEIVYGYRRHAHDRFEKHRYRYTHVFVRLEEGEGPGHSGPEPPPSGWTKMADYYKYLRDRRIKYPL
uniref:Large ribosomal subunit protein uL22m n=1 Tax=Plectus sambesii TaxID=2011161 RepID=A0A914VYA2_9BILA